MDLETPVAQVMNRAVVTVLATQPLAEARRVMTEGGIHHVPVVADGRVVGILSSLDLLRVATGVDALPLQSTGQALTIASLMSRDVAQIRADGTVRQAIELLAARQIHCLPVVDESGLLVGLLTTLDLVRTWLRP